VEPKGKTETEAKMPSRFDEAFRLFKEAGGEFPVALFGFEKYYALAAQREAFDRESRSTGV